MESKAGSGKGATAVTFVIGVGLIIVGYTLLDWGHYVAAGHRVSLWYLISGQTQQENQTHQLQHMNDQPAFIGTGSAVKASQQISQQTVDAAKRLIGH